MTRLPVLFRCILLLSVGVWLTGCKPLPESDTDDQKNPDFQKGEIRKKAMDHKGAVEAFEAALRRNPRSAAAHLELGLLYEHHMADFATAIYHYQKHLALKPASNVAEMIRGRIEACKLELVKSVALSTVPQHVQATLDRLAGENAELRKQVVQLTAQLQQQIDRPPQQALQSGSGASNFPPTPGAQSGGTIVVAEANNPPLRAVDSPRPTVRTHTVKHGETMFAIGRMYGFRNGDEIRAANPQVDPTNMRAGVILNIPAGRN